MPSRPCRHPTCDQYVTGSDRYCAAHREAGTAERASYQSHYDQHARDPEAKCFYASAAWQRARATKLANNPICEHCRRVFAQHVHHVIPLAKCRPDQTLAQTNLLSVCQPCHSAIEAAERSNPV